SSLNNLTKEVVIWNQDNPDVFGVVVNLQKWLEDKAPGSVTAEAVEKQLASDPKVQTVRLGLGDPTKAASLVRFVAAIEDEEKVRTAAIKEAVENAKKTIEAPRPQLSFSYGYQRDATTSDYSFFKVLLSYKNDPKMSYNLNAEWDVNNKSTSSTGA